MNASGTHSDSEDSLGNDNIGRSRDSNVADNQNFNHYSITINTSYSDVAYGYENQSGSSSSTNNNRNSASKGAARRAAALQKLKASPTATAALSTVANFTPMPTSGTAAARGDGGNDTIVEQEQEQLPSADSVGSAGSAIAVRPLSLADHPLLASLTSLQMSAVPRMFQETPSGRSEDDNPQLQLDGDPQLTFALFLAEQQQQDTDITLSPASSSAPPAISQLELLATPRLNYRDMSPEEAAQSLFDNLIIDVPKEKIVSVITKNDNFHKSILQQFMNCLDVPQNIVEALRSLCAHVTLKGEAQQIDRLLVAFAGRWWDAHAALDSTTYVYRSQDIVYGLMFVTILLNTDMYSANVRKKMTLKEFIANTMRYVDSIVKDDETVAASISDPVEEDAWRKELNAVLTGLYVAVKEDAIFIPQDLKPGISGSSNGVSIAGNGYHTLPRGKVSAAIYGNRTPSPMQSGGSLHRRLSPVRSSNSSEKSVSSKKINVDALPAQIRRELRPFWSGDEFYDDESLTDGMSLEGLLVRKMMDGENGSKPQYRSWVPLWCVVSVSQSKGVELNMFEVEGDAEGDVWMAHSNVLDVSRIRVPNRPPEVVTILHSHSKALPNPGYNASRPFVFFICLTNGVTYLFQTKSKYDLRQWTDTLNYWTARYSMGPIRGGGVGNADYGWSEFEWETWRLAGIVSGEYIGGSRKNLDEWETPKSSTLVVSVLDLEEQLEMLEKQLVSIMSEYNAHISYKSRIERKYILSFKSKSRALTNWNKKLNYLESERDRYTMYTNILKASMVATREVEGVIEFDTEKKEGDL
ncbi:hypothetical protein HK100_007145, partial [Physocladia obscura]